MTVMERPGSLEADELHTLLTALVALRKGDASVRLPLHWPGMAGKVADAFNDVVEQNARDGRASWRGCARWSARKASSSSAPRWASARGFWGDSIESINSLIDDLVHPTSEVARVIGAVAQGDLSQEHGARGRRPAAARASSCAPPRPSTRWSTSSAPSPPR